MFYNINLAYNKENKMVNKYGLVDFKDPIFSSLFVGFDNLLRT